MKVAVVWATPALQDIVEVELDAEATIADAVERSGFVEHYKLDATLLGVAIFGRRATPETRVADGDRIELTRPLEVDPKAARIARARAKPLPKPPRRVKHRPS